MAHLEHQIAAWYPSMARPLAARTGPQRIT
jgi:hypothetical protein